MPKLRDIIPLEQLRALNELGLQLEIQERRARNKAAREFLSTANAELAKAADPIVVWTAPNGDVYTDRKSVICDIIANGSWR